MVAPSRVCLDLFYNGFLVANSIIRVYIADCVDVWMHFQLADSVDVREAWVRRGARSRGWTDDNGEVFVAVLDDTKIRFS